MAWVDLQRLYDVVWENGGTSIAVPHMLCYTVLCVNAAAVCIY